MKYKIKESAKHLLIPYSPTKELLDANFINAAIVDRLKNNDFEGVIDLITTYLDVLNKVKASQQTY